MWIQLIQQYVKKSRTTILPERSLLADRGLVVLNHSQSVNTIRKGLLTLDEYEIDHCYSYEQQIEFHNNPFESDVAFAKCK